MVRVRGGFRALELTLLLSCLGVACGGTVRDDSASAGSDMGGGASVAGASGNAGSPVQTGGSTGTSGGAGAGSGSAGEVACIGAPEPCVSNCDSAKGIAYQVCQNGVWQCAAGVDESTCPSSYCSPQTMRCCDEASAASSASTCDLVGAPVCAPGSDPTVAFTPCVVKPVVCRGASVGTLQGQPCTLGDSECDFGYGLGTSFCTCQSLAGAEPTWSCGGLAR
jgi:hypothetical protein